jgi:glycosyltransferase involved in cell wall biosynthesis
MVKLAHYCSARVVSSVATSYPYKTDKLTLIGQAIDTELFRPKAADPDPGLVLNVGRLSPIKDLHTLVEAVHRLKQRHIDVRCVLIGETPEIHASYARSLRAQISRLELDETFHFAGLLPQKEIASWCQRCEVHINLSPSGFFDKAALEAAACGRPGIVANEAFREVLGEHADQLLFRHGDSADLACKLERLLALPIHDRHAIGASLRARVVELHGFDRLFDRLMVVLREVASRRVQP